MVVQQRQHLVKLAAGTTVSSKRALQPVQYLVKWATVTSMIGIIGLQQIQVIVKLPLYQLLWKSSTRSLSTAGSSTLDMCSTCCILVTKTTASTVLM